MNKNSSLAIFTPNIGTLSETFIKRHIQLLMPNNTVVVSGNIFDRSWLSCPLLQIPYTEGPAKYQPDIEDKVYSFLETHRVTHILCEYGCYGTEIIELNQRRLKLSIFVHFHGGDASALLRGEQMVQYYKWMGQQVTGVIAVAKPMAMRLAGIGIPAEKIKIVHSGIEIPEKIIAMPEKSPCRFISVMRFVHKKGPTYLLKAFAKAKEVVSDIMLDIIGDGYLLTNVGPLHKEVYEFVDSNNLSSSVILHGGRLNDYVKKMLDNACVYVQHSITDPVSGDAEGLPISILEASAAGLPVISTYHEGIPEEVEHNVTGFLVKEFDVDKMAECMIFLAKNSQLRKEMGLAARKKIEKEFDVNDSIKNLRTAMGMVSI